VAPIAAAPAMNSLRVTRFIALILQNPLAAVQRWE
jgi:hypothetical protein